MTAAPGTVPAMPNVTSVENSSAAPPAKENIKQEITIKEITPVSEIPIITDVKIKEILPSPSIEVAEYSSSKSPLIPREATSEKSATNQVEITERPVIIEILPSSSPIFIASSPTEIVASSSEISETKTNDLPPSKISLSTQDSINSEIYPSNEPHPGTVGSPAVIQEIIPVSTTTKNPVIIEEDDPTLFDHNPAFPPIPDDLSVQGNHEDEPIPDQNTDSYHVSGGQDVVSVTSTTTESSVVSEVVVTTSKDIPDVHTPTSNKPVEITTVKSDNLETVSSSTQEVPMLNLRSAIPTEILNVPSSVPEEITGELDDIAETTTISTESAPVATTTEAPKKEDLVTPVKVLSSSEIVSTNPTIMGMRILESSTTQNVETSSMKVVEEEAISTTVNSDTPTEITSQTEFSSLPIETSDQNPHEESVKEKQITSSAGPTVYEITPTKLLPVAPEVITVSKNTPPNIENQSLENVETTEFILTSFGSAESATDAIELIKISPDAGKSAAIIESVDGKKTNVLTDLINLVGDVASISDHTDAPAATRHVTSPPSISDSEELIPVNAGYKSKNSNWNLNSITEVVPKSKQPVSINKQKAVEIEDDEDGLTDSPPPNDKHEPTTRRPIIDNVSDDMPENKTDKKDIEIISPYSPAAKRPTKVVMKKNNEKPLSDEVSLSEETATDSTVTSSEITTSEEPNVTSSEARERIEESSNSTTNATPQ